MNDKANELCLTMKGIALMKLVEAGVIQREEDGNVNTDGFETFWDSFERNLYTAMDNAMEELSRSYQSGEKASFVLDQQAEKERDARAENGRKQRHPCLRSLVAFFAGAIIMALLETFGLGCFLFGLALFFLGSVFIKFF